MGDGVGALNQELKYGFALSSPSVVSHCQSTKEHPNLSVPGRFFRVASFNFDRVSQYLVALIVPTFLTSSNKTPWAFQKFVRREMVDPRFIPRHNPKQKVCFEAS
ncbi:hypothetical protein TNCV_674491 [Trichonephila clavipes]|nr:hypothetical protein TNCV_674491 [Trichonephila clavipes]